MFGPFDPIFDLNKDGKMSAFEKGAEADYIERMCREDQFRNSRNSDHSWRNQGIDNDTDSCDD